MRQCPALDRDNLGCGSKRGHFQLLKNIDVMRRRDAESGMTPEESARLGGPILTSANAEPIALLDREGLSANHRNCDGWSADRSRRVRRG